MELPALPSLALALLAGLLGLAAVVVYLRRNYGQVERCGVPMVTPTFCFGSGPWRLHQVIGHEVDMAMFKKFGRLWGQYDMSTPWLAVADPDILRKILVKNFDIFPHHQFTIADQKIRTLDSANGQEWKELRRGLSPTFSPGKVRGMLELLGGGVDQMTEHLEEVTKEDSLVAVKDTFQKMTLDVIARCAFGLQSNSFQQPDNQLLTFGRQIMDDFLLRDFSSAMFWHLSSAIEPILAKCVDLVPSQYRNLWEIASKICQEREARGPGQGDFVDRLLELRRKHEAGEFPALTKEQITGQSIVFILAGFETTASTLSSLTYFLVKHPATLERLVAEVDDQLATFEGRVDHETIAGMPYLEACIKEAMRLVPPVVRTDRTSVADWQEDGLFIPRGMNILIPVYVIHHDPELWPEPELFLPERFLKENSGKIKACSWIPFGAGPRACIGERFAMVEIKIAMTKLLSKFRLEDDDLTKMVFTKGDQMMTGYGEIFVRMFERSDQRSPEK